MYVKEDGQRRLTCFITTSPCDHNPVLGVVHSFKVVLTLFEGGARAGGMAQRLRALAVRSSSSPEFNSQQPHGGSQTSIMGSDALFWCVWKQLQCTHIHEINTSLKKKKKMVLLWPQSIPLDVLNVPTLLIYRADHQAMNLWGTTHMVMTPSNPLPIHCGHLQLLCRVASDMPQKTSALFSCRHASIVLYLQILGMVKIPKLSFIVPFEKEPVRWWRCERIFQIT